MNLMNTIAASLTDGTGIVDDIKMSGVRQEGIMFNGQRITDPKMQQAIMAAQHFESLPKGDTLLITVDNTGAATRDFTLFDADGILRDNGVAPANHADLEISTNFYGGLPYAALLKFLQSARPSAVGLSIEYSDTNMRNTSALKVYTGSLQNKTNQSLQEYVQGAKSKIITDQKIIDIRANFYINPLFAFGGKIPAGKQITFTFNIVLWRNF